MNMKIFSDRKLFYPIIMVVLFLGMTIILKYHFIFPLDHLPVWYGDHRDSAQMSWNLWHVAESILDLENPFLTKNVFFPVGANLTTHTLVSGFLPFTLLVKLFSGGHLLYPVYAYKLSVLLSYLLIMMFTYLMLKEAGFGFLPSLLPATAYAFGSFYSEHAVHLNLLAGFIIPLNIFLFIRAYKRPVFLNCMLCGFSLGVSVYFSEFALFVFTGLFLYLVLMLIFGESRNAFFEKIAGAGWISICCSIGIFVLIVAPFLYYWHLSEALIPEQKWLRELSANLFGFFIPNTWSTPLYGDLFGPVTSSMAGKGIGGFEAFLGYPLILFSFIGFFRIKSAYEKCAVISGVFFLALALGPILQVFSHDTGIWMPYWLLKDLPLFDQNRSPVRLVAMAMPLLCFAMAPGLEFVYRKIKENVHVYVGYFFFFVVMVWIVAESYRLPETEYKQVRIPANIESQLVEGPCLQIPIISSPNNQMLLQTMHGHKVMTVFLARNSSAQQHLVSRFQSAFNSDPNQFVNLFRQYGYKNLVVAEKLPVFEIQQIKRLPLKVVDIYFQPEEIVYETGKRLPPGTSGNHPAAHVMNPYERKNFYLNKIIYSRRLDLMVNGKDIYTVRFFMGNRSVGELTALPFFNISGHRWRMIDIPENIQNTGFDRIELVLESETQGSFACLILSK